MMGLAKMGPAGWRYYAEEIVLGREDFYMVRGGEELGLWVGRGAEVLGLSGPVTAEGLERLFGHGCHPESGEPLGRRLCLRLPGPSPTASPEASQSRSQPVAGYALSFSPPKSVSLVWGLGDDETMRVVRAAHDAAVAQALVFLEEHAAFCRRGHGGAVQADTDGLVAASFTHRTSRAGDPQLHSHVLVANRVRAASDGRWLSLDGRELYEVQKAAGLVYKAGLRAELTERLGVAWTEVDRNGGAEIAGVPAALIEGFSKRRQDVKLEGARLVADREVTLGRSLTPCERAECYQRATYQTRAAKGHDPHTTGELRARWRAEAIAAGGDPDGWLSRVRGRHPTVRPHAGRAAVFGQMVTSKSTWGRADVVEALACMADGHSLAEETRRWIERSADEILGLDQVVSLNGEDPGETPAFARRRDGMTPTERHGGRRYTSVRTLETEQKILDTVEVGRHAEVAVTPARTVEDAIGECALDGDQADAVRRLCRGGERVALLVGPAGSGKSHTLAAARSAWNAERVPVIGVAPSAVAAGVLYDQAEIPAETVARFLVSLEGGRVRLPKGVVVVCDEASMLATADLARLVETVTRADGKLVLVGDHKQLGSVDAGGLFSLLVADAATADLTGVHRFVDPWEAQATKRLRAGDVTVIGEYLQRGRVVGGDRDLAIDRAFELWSGARGCGRSVVVTAGDHQTVDQLALRARAARVAAGQVEPGGIRAGGQIIGRGDEVVTCRNERRLVTTTGAWVRNGDRWTVTGRHEDGTLDLSSLEGRGRVTLPAEYTANHLTLGYAVTVHKAQGVTVDESILVVDARTSGEHLYVGLSRGRQSNTACVITEPTGDEHQTAHPKEPQQVLEAVMGRSGNEPSATQVWRQQLDHIYDLPSLKSLLAECRRRVDAAAGPDRQPEINRLQHQLARIADAPARLADAEQRLARLHNQRHQLDHQSQQPPPTGPPQPARRWWHRQPDPPPALTPTADTSDQTQRIDRAIRQAEADITTARSDIDQHHRQRANLDRLQQAQQQRHTWIDNHPEIGSFAVDLSGRINHATAAIRRRNIIDAQWGDLIRHPHPSPHRTAHQPDTQHHRGPSM
jgi:conjugative relaxase-like TrwC/TraI family protein